MLIQGTPFTNRRGLTVYTFYLYDVNGKCYSGSCFAIKEDGICSVRCDV